MDTTTAPQPVAAPAAAPSAAPAAPAAPSTPINSVTQKPISEAAHNLFKMLESSGDPLREEPAVKTEVKPEPEAPAKVEPAAAPAADEKPIKVSKKPVKRPELPIPKDEPAAPPAAPAAPAPAAPTDSKWEESLLDDEKAALEDARFAEKVDPKFKGLAEKMGKFFRDQKAYLEKHPEADEDDAGYKKILATQPSLSAADKRFIAEARIEERVSGKYKPEIERIEHELFRRDEEPKIEQEAAQIRHHMAFNALPKEMLDTLKEKGLPVLQKEYADELEVAGNLINTLTEDAKELLRITRFDPKTKRPLGDVANDASHPKYEQHNRIATMVNEVCSDFQKNASQAEQVRDGKWFVTREEWAKLPPNSRHQFWTFTNSEQHVREMIQRAMAWMPDAVSRSIKARRDYLTARGYERKRVEAPAATPPATPPQPTASTSSPRTAPSPAPSSTPAGQLTPGQQLARRLASEG